jgi:hypothetical protein
LALAVLSLLIDSMCLAVLAEEAASTAAWDVL